MEGAPARSRARRHPPPREFLHIERGLLDVRQDIMALVTETGAERSIVAHVRMFICDNWAAFDACWDEI